MARTVGQTLTAETPKSVDNSTQNDTQRSLGSELWLRLQALPIPWEQGRLFYVLDAQELHRQAL